MTPSKLILSAILAIGLLLPSASLWANAQTSSTIATNKPQIVNLSGTIHKIAVEGTCYQFAADSGKKYELIGKFPKIDGARVQVRGVVATDMMTLCQVGQPLKVKNIRTIK